MHNKVASVVSLAKTMQMALDLAKENTLVPTRSLELILNTMIEVGQDNSSARAVYAQQTAFLASKISGVEAR